MGVDNKIIPHPHGIEIDTRFVLSLFQMRNSIIRNILTKGALELRTELLLFSAWENKIKEGSLRLGK